MKNDAAYFTFVSILFAIFPSWCALNLHCEVLMSNLLKNVCVLWSLPFSAFKRVFTFTKIPCWLFRATLHYTLISTNVDDLKTFIFENRAPETNLTRERKNKRNLDNQVCRKNLITFDVRTAFSFGQNCVFGASMRLPFRSQKNAYSVMFLWKMLRKSHFT